MTHIKYDNLDAIIRLAEFAHFGYKDHAGNDYINHPLRVLRAVQEEGAPPYVQFAAALHDTTEDTAWTLEMLNAFGVPSATVNLVRLLDRGESKREFDSFSDFNLNMYLRLSNLAHDVHELLSRYPGQEDVVRSRLYKAAHGTFYYGQILQDPEAVRIKRADIRDNRLPWRVSYLPLKQQAHLNEKYDDAEAMLSGERDFIPWKEPK